jgi:hypothetical protein
MFEARANPSLNTAGMGEFVLIQKRALAAVSHNYAWSKSLASCKIRGELHSLHLVTWQLYCSGERACSASARRLPTWQAAWRHHSAVGCLLAAAESIVRPGRCWPLFGTRWTRAGSFGHSSCSARRWVTTRRRIRRHALDATAPRHGLLLSREQTPLVRGRHPAVSQLRLGPRGPNRGSDLGVS